MRTIPVPERNPVGRGNGGTGAVPIHALVNNVKADEGALNAPNRAMVGLGNAIAGAGEVMGQFAIQKQNQINKGILANEETVRMNTASEIQSFFEQNPDKPELWGEYSNKAWKAYEAGRTERAKKGNWGDEVRANDELSFKLFREDFAVRARSEQDKAYIRQSNARLEANAETKLRAGDYEGFVASIDAMNLFPDVKERKVRQGLEEGLYRIAGNQLDALRDLPPSKAIPAIEAFVANLDAKGKDGRFKDYEFERGGLSLGAREQLKTIAQARIREQERVMAVNGRAIVSDIRMGSATVADVMNAVKAGELTPDIAKALMPEVSIAVGEWEAKVDAKDAAAQAKAEAKQRREQEEIQQRANKTESLRVAALERGKVGLRDIDQQLARGEIDPDQAAKLKEELIQASRAEIAMEKGDYQVIHERIAGGMGAWAAGRQPDDAEYQSIQNDILNAKTLTKETRLKLMDELFQMKLADMADLEEEGPAGRFMDRTISSAERDLRRGMIAEYRKLLPALGEMTAGDLLLNQEKRIRSFFDSAKGGQRTLAEIEKFRDEQLVGEARKAAGFLSLQEAFKF